MTDRFAGYVVVLEDNIRSDDAEVITKAIEQLRGVLKVTPVIRTPEIHIAEERVRNELGQKLLQIVYPRDK